MPNLFSPFTAVGSYLTKTTDQTTVGDVPAEAAPNAHHTPARSQADILGSHGDQLDTNSGGNNGTSGNDQGGGQSNVGSTPSISPTKSGADALRSVARVHASRNGSSDNVRDCVLSLVESAVSAIDGGMDVEQWSETSGLPTRDGVAVFNAIRGFGGASSARAAVSGLFTFSSPAVKEVKESGGGVLNLNNVRAAILQPSFYADPAETLGPAAVANQPWAVVLAAAPLDRNALLANPLYTKSNLLRILDQVEKTPTAWLLNRHTFLLQCGRIFVHHLASNLLNDMPRSAAASAAYLIVNSTVGEAAVTTTIFRAVGVELSRSTSPGEALCVFIRAADALLSPRDSTCYASWVSCTPQLGETALTYYDRLVLLGSVQGRSPQDVFDRFRSALVVLEDRTDATTSENMAVVQIGSRIMSLDIATLGRTIRNDPIFKMVLLQARKPAPKTQSEEEKDKENMTLVVGGRAPAQAYNLHIFYAACKRCGIADFGIVPPSRTHDACPICVFRGKDPTHTFDGGPIPSGKNCKHNVWRCREIPFMAQQCAATGKVTLEDAMQKIDNPNEVSQMLPSAN